MTPMPPSNRTSRSRSYRNSSRSCAATGANSPKASTAPNTLFIIVRTLLVVVRFVARVIPRSKAGLFKFFGQGHAKRLPCARQAGHHGADRKIHRVRELPVGQTVEFAAH